jgi:membrane-bound metal-dependent hydrolase YbcI (DUF457 family)
MDVLAHGLWSNVMYRIIPQTRNHKKHTLWGIAFGVLPDLVAFAPFFADWFWKIITNQASATFGRPDFAETALTRYAAESYNYTHSFVVFIFFLLIVWVTWKKFPWFLLGWGLHIAVDIFSHSREFYPTPFLFPFSDYNVNGVSWAHPIFMAINYGLLFIFYIFILPRLFKKSQPIHK